MVTFGQSQPLKAPCKSAIVALSHQSQYSRAGYCSVTESHSFLLRHRHLHRTNSTVQLALPGCSAFDYDCPSHSLPHHLLRHQSRTRAARLHLDESRMLYSSSVEESEHYTVVADHRSRRLRRRLHHHHHPSLGAYRCWRWPDRLRPSRLSRL